MRSRRHYLGTGFDIWGGRPGWFWMVVSPHRDVGTIGSAATEADALNEARASIEAMILRDRPARLQASLVPADRCWEGLLNKLQRFLHEHDRARYVAR